MRKYGDAEVIEFEGRKYRRYPNATGISEQRYFKCRGRHLHRDIWKSNYGEIPRGYHIHHIDKNPLNNSISNLECISDADPRFYFLYHNQLELWSLRQLGDC